MKVIQTELAPKAVGTYSQGMEYGGVFYFSGQIGLDIQTGNMQPTFDLQLSQIFKNIDGLLTSQNLKRENIIKTTVFLTDLNDFAKVNQAYLEFFKAPYPARSTVQVAALPKGALVEIEVIAGK
jgi:2-iminobutanoate/2-iminopropanoate deaminase